jgi:hypothetical protein
MDMRVRRRTKRYFSPFSFFGGYNDPGVTGTNGKRVAKHWNMAMLGLYTVYGERSVMVW